MKSAGVRDFMSFLRAADVEHGAAVGTVKETEAKTQDILHFLELNKCRVCQRIEYSEQLTEIRRERRNAKDEIEVLAPLINWVKENQKAVNSLSEVLGKMRKAEKKWR